MCLTRATVKLTALWSLVKRIVKNQASVVVSSSPTKALKEVRKWLKGKLKEAGIEAEVLLFTG